VIASKLTFQDEAAGFLAKVKYNMYALTVLNVRSSRARRIAASSIAV
jgi:hypothetical protein